jgi:hypothetical protein
MPDRNESDVIAKNAILTQLRDVLTAELKLAGAEIPDQLPLSGAGGDVISEELYLSLHVIDLLNIFIHGSRPPLSR